MHKTLDFTYLWLKNNIDVIFFIYGLAFVVMGLAIWLQPKKGSSFRLADCLWLLSGFGLIHGANEWLDMWVIIKGGNPGLQLLRLLVLIISYLFFFEFGRQVIRLNNAKGSSFIARFGRQLSWKLTWLLTILAVILGFLTPDPWKNINIWARYLLGFPSGTLSAAGLLLYYIDQKDILVPLKVRPYFFVASLSLFAYGILSGLVVARGEPLLSRLFNMDSFFIVAHIPVQVFRALCAVAAAWGITGILTIFKWESIERLQVKVAERTRELTAANESLKDAYTRLQETQSQLIQAAKLTAVGELASSVAHEVRNPLGVILQGVNYLEERVSSKEKDISETLSMLKDGVSRADRIINGLLDFSRFTVLRLQPEEINAIIEDSLGLVSKQLETEKVKIIKDLRVGLLKVLADKNKLEQVFINLLLNADQAMPEGGSITIRSYDKRLAKEKEGERFPFENFRAGERVVVVELEDTGIGISAENLKKIFNPFFTTKGARKGTGLGLSVSRNILQLHRGAIYAESRVGKGTKITVVLKTSGGR